MRVAQALFSSSDLDLNQSHQSPLAAATMRLFGTPPENLALAVVGIAAVALGHATPLSLAIGGAVSLLGEALRISAAGYGFSRGSFAVRGPYRFVRHPYLLGTALLHLGVWLASLLPWAVAAGLVVLAVVLRHKIRRDEALYAGRLGMWFVDYRLATPAMVPRLWPVAALGRGEEAHFSLRTALLTGRHRELATLLGLGVVFGLLALTYILGAKELFGLAIVVTVSLVTAGRVIYVWRTSRRTTH